MKQLFIIRHGKSDWGNPFQDDFDRPLNHRGLIDAKKMGSYLSNYTHPQKIISSTAKRAITTAYLIGDQLKINQHEIEQQKKLYQAPLDKLLEMCDNNQYCGSIALKRSGGGNLYNSHKLSP